MCTSSSAQGRRGSVPSRLRNSRCSMSPFSCSICAENWKGIGLWGRVPSQRGTENAIVDRPSPPSPRAHLRHRDRPLLFGSHCKLFGRSRASVGQGRWRVDHRCPAHATACRCRWATPLRATPVLKAALTRTSQSVEMVFSCDLIGLVCK